MTPSNELHQLIHSLNKNERKWLSNHAQKGSDYQRLFDAIRKQKVYDEEKLKEKFRNESFIHRFSATKNYLFKFILHELFLQYINNDSESSLFAQIHYCELLMRKGLLNTAYKRILKLKKICVEDELFRQAILAISIQRSILYLSNNERDFSLLEQTYQEEQTILKKHGNWVDYLYLNSQLSDYRNKNFVARTQDESIFYKDFLKHPLLQNEDQALTRFTQFIYNRLIGECLTRLNEHQKAIHFRKRAVELYEGVYSKNEKFFRYYTMSLAELGFTLCDIQQTDHALAVVKQIYLLEKKYPKTYSSQNRINLFTSWSVLELYTYYHSGRFEEGGKRLEDVIERSIQKRYVDMNPVNLLALNFNTIRVYYGANQYRKALRRIAAIINERADDIGNDIVCFLYLLRLMIHIEVSDDDLIASIGRSTANFLQKKKRLYRTETLILGLSQKIVDKSPKERIDLFEKTKIAFDKISGMKSEERLIEYFDFSSWFTSRINQRSFAEVFREKLLRKN